MPAAVKALTGLTFREVSAQSRSKIRQIFPILFSRASSRLLLKIKQERKTL
jgi:hypothetical protein